MAFTKLGDLSLDLNDLFLTSGETAEVPRTEEALFEASLFVLIVGGYLAAFII